MKPSERVLNRIKNEPIDKIPNLNIIMMFAAREIGVPYSKYCQNHRLLVEGNIVCAEKYGLDCVTTMSDPVKETSALGGKVIFPEDDVPYVEDFPIKNSQDLLKAHPVNPCDSSRMTESVRAIELYRKKCKDEFAIIGWVEGCMAEAADLHGVNNFLVDLLDDTEFVTALLDLCLEQAILFARDQIKAGADIIGVGDAIASVAGPIMYEEFALPYELKLLKAIRDMGAKTKLHICGNILPFIDLIPSDYCDIIDVDWMVPLEKVAAIHGQKSCISGNYDPVDVLLMGNKKKIAEAVESCARIGGEKYISAAGCEVPRRTPPENLKAVDDTLKNLMMH